MNMIRLVRNGRMSEVYPDMFPAGPLQGGIVANMIDVMAHDLSEVLAPLPTFNCASSKSVSDASPQVCREANADRAWVCGAFGSPAGRCTRLPTNTLLTDTFRRLWRLTRMRVAADHIHGLARRVSSL